MNQDDSLRTERALLGFLIYEQKALALVKPIISRISYFTAPAHGIIYTAMLDLEEQKYDELIIGSHLKKHDKLKAIGGYSYLAELLECAPAACNIVYYAKLIRQEYHVKKSSLVAAGLQQSLKNEKISAYDLVSQTIEDLQKLQAELGEQAKRVRSVAELMPIVYKEMEDTSDGKITPALSTGFDNLDAYLGGGLRPAEFVILAARPGVGKTSLVVNIANNLSPKEKVLFISLETTGELLTLCRLLPINSGVSSTALRSPKNMTADDWNKVSEASSRLGTYNNFKICDQSGMNIEDVEALVGQEMKLGGVRLLIVDYLQLLGSRTRFKQREERVSHISKKLSDLIKKHNLCSIICAQLNRELEKTNRRPVIADLRESGQLEQDADIILLGYRDKTDQDAPTLIEIAKNRNGATGDAELFFNKRTTNFRERGDSVNF